MSANESPSPLGEGLGWGLPSERELLSRAKAMRREPTEWEKRLWRRLSNSQLDGYKFRRQAVIGSYICDFFCPAKGLVVEIDGDTHDAERDGRRDAALARKGFMVLRFTNGDVRNNMSGVLETIALTLSARHDRWSGRPHPQPHPRPSPEGEGSL